MTSTKKKLLVLLAPAILILIADQISKYLVRTSPELHNYTIFEGWLKFNYTQNPGMALGMDWLSTPTISIVAIVATIGIFIYIIKNIERANFAYLTCMGLILGGALGNITDRFTMGIIEGHGGILYGHVVDFIHFNLEIGDTAVFPYIFNIADVAISTSIIIMILFNKKIMPVEDKSDETENESESEQLQAEWVPEKSNDEIPADPENISTSNSDSPRETGS
ncbi:MAG: signal peptidase II [Balneolaceae bacterium]